MKKVSSLLVSVSLHAALPAVIVGLGALVRSSIELSTFSVRIGDAATSAVRIDRSAPEPVVFEPTRQPTPALPTHDEPQMEPTDVEIPIEVQQPSSPNLPQLREPRPLLSAERLPVPATDTSAAPAAEAADAEPTEIVNPAPAYPEIARRRGHEGAVAVIFTVTTEGKCADVSVERSSGYATLDSSSVDAVRMWRFRPATKNGRPVPSAQRVRFVFKLQS